MCCFTVFRSLSGEFSHRRSHIKVRQEVKSVSQSWVELVQRASGNPSLLCAPSDPVNVDFFVFISICLALCQGCDFQVQGKENIWLLFLVTSSYKNSVWKNESEKSHERQNCCVWHQWMEAVGCQTILPKGTYTISWCTVQWRLK